MNKKLRYGSALTALLLLAPAFPRAARATDIISNFNVQGTAQNVSGGTLGTCAYNATCAFSGTMAVDITAGSVTQFDVTFPGRPTFSTISSQNYASQVVSDSSSSWVLEFDFTASPTPGTLVGFTGGTITNGSVNIQGPLQFQTYGSMTGTISAASTAPEPDALALLAAGLLGLGFFTWRRRRDAVPRA